MLLKGPRFEIVEMLQFGANRCEFDKAVNAALFTVKK